MVDEYGRDRPDRDGRRLNGDSRKRSGDTGGPEERYSRHSRSRSPLRSSGRTGSDDRRRDDHHHRNGRVDHYQRRSRRRRSISESRERSSPPRKRDAYEDRRRGEVSGNFESRGEQAWALSKMSKEERFELRQKTKSTLWSDVSSEEEDEHPSDLENVLATESRNDDSAIVADLPIVGEMRSPAHEAAAIDSAAEDNASDRPAVDLAVDKHDSKDVERNDSDASDGHTDRKHNKKDKKKYKRRHKRSKRKEVKKRRKNSNDEESSDASDFQTIASTDELETARFKKDVQGHRLDPPQDSDEDVGPKPLQETDSTSAKNISYGGALMPGEGEAIAQYVQKNMRIPRRGEVGWSGNEIENLEGLGYVMSGSRHKRMNAIRIRKENQVYTAEEKRALALINFEERQQRENKVLGEFRTMLQQKLGTDGVGVIPDAAAADGTETS